MAPLQAGSVPAAPGTHFSGRLQGLHPLSTHCQLHGLSMAFSCPSYTQTQLGWFPVSFVKPGVFAVDDNTGFPTIQQGEHRSTGRAVWLDTAGNRKSSQGDSASTPHHQPGLGLGRPTAAHFQWQMTSPTSASQTERSLCSATTGYCAGVHGNSHSPFISQFTSFQAIKKEQPGTGAAISHCTAPHPWEKQLPALLVLPSSAFQALPKRAQFSASEFFGFVFWGFFERGQQAGSMERNGKKESQGLNTQKCRDTLNEKQSLSPPHSPSQKALKSNTQEKE